MVGIRIFATIAFLGSTMAHFGPRPPVRNPGCGDVDIFFTGLPPFHPLVIEQGFDPSMVDNALRLVLAGPEQDVGIYADRLRGKKWQGTGVGYGVRGARLPDLTVRLEGPYHPETYFNIENHLLICPPTDIIQTYRDKAPQAKIVFNTAPDNALQAIQRRFPLSSNCTGHPGTDLLCIIGDWSQPVLGLYSNAIIRTELLDTVRINPKNMKACIQQV
ncbi:hypothetical protein B0A52_06415 [Exophiala mesophila]|uniref:Uncharacterized protein n=1 Tax=Exophiala mesophila TaxID=212818 RepID=A0A438N210_EXOME|nr:hypothetical protein B0A52_06415 [Exophiala mesophila]